MAIYEGVNLWELTLSGAKTDDGDTALGITKGCNPGGNAVLSY